MSYYEKYIKYKNKYLILKNSLQEGGEFDETLIEGLKSKEYMIPAQKIMNREQFANSPNYFIAYKVDNDGLFNKKNTKFYNFVPKKNSRDIDRYIRKNKITVTVTLPKEKGKVVKKKNIIGTISDVYESKGFVIIYV